LRGLFGLSAMFTLVLALSLLPIADVTACIFAAPIFATALSVPILKENVGLRRWSAIMMGFVGVLVIVRPGMEGFQPAILVAIAAALFFAMASNAIRSIAQSEDGLTIVFYFMMLLALVSGFALPFGWRMPDLVGSILFIGLGLCGGAGQILMTAAYRLAPVAVIMPLEYTTLLWTSLFGYWLWGEVMTAGTIAGAGLVVASGLYIVHREAVLRRARS
ncbi:MAG: DMT family transporter, partial [Alphaproteobacteria bacterium]|nr:DMT family transporter [Alphaproteobacteria bacterium]